MATPSVCLTPACLQAASSLAWQIAPNWDNMDPCTDFDKLVCHRYPTLNPTDTDGYGQLDDRNGRVLRGILESTYQEAISNQLISWNSTFTSNAVDEANFGMLKRAYQSCMDTEAIAETGTKPLVDLIASLNSMWPIKTGDLKAKMTKEDYNGLTEVMAFLEELGISTFQLLRVLNTPWDAKIKNIRIDGTAPRQRNISEYEDPQAMSAYANQTSQTVLEYFPGNISAQTASSIAEGIVNLERAFLEAQANLSIQGLWDLDLAYNLTLKEAANFYSLDKVIKAVAPGYPADRPMTLIPKVYFNNVTEIIASQPKAVLQSFLLLRAVDALSTEVDSTATGNQKDRVSYCLKHMELDLKHALSRFFAASAYPDGARKLAGDMAANIRSTLKARIAKLDWMSADAKARAVKKVDNMVQTIGYFSSPTVDVRSPESLAAYYKGLNITTNYFSNVIAERRHSTAQNMAAVTKPADRALSVGGDDFAWKVNAAYASIENSITLSAGIFQQPFFSDQLPGYASYGSLGAVVGHEVVHGFDNNGRRYNEDALPVSWWDNATVAAYEERAQCFVKQFSEYEYPLPGGKTAKTDGKQTLGENISDAGGLQLAFDAWKKTQETKKDAGLPGLEKFTPEQLFFMFYATGWCNSYSPEYIQRRVPTDEHAFHTHRILGTTANSRAFREAFKCKVKEPTCEIF